MAVSAITRVPFALPNMPARPTYELTDRDRRLLSYDALKVWIKPAGHQNAWQHDRQWRTPAACAGI